MVRIVQSGFPGSAIPGICQLGSFGDDQGRGAFSVHYLDFAEGDLDFFIRKMESVKVLDRIPCLELLDKVSPNSKRLTKFFSTKGGSTQQLIWKWKDNTDGVTITRIINSTRTKEDHNYDFPTIFYEPCKWGNEAAQAYALACSHTESCAGSRAVNPSHTSKTRSTAGTAAQSRGLCHVIVTDGLVGLFSMNAQGGFGGGT
ncbi:hypothetical protein EDB89DRAFT_1905027 [Lactarius sanguifluus]|nr:hypothetical protein EDB89DRAFT_1905027 [Lactarius sanguifluus]